MECIFKYNSYFKSDFINVDIEVLKICLMLKNHIIKPKEDFIKTIDFTLRELLNNAVEHGNKMNSEKTVEYIIELTKQSLLIEVKDQGDGACFQYTHENNIDEIRKRGIRTLKQLGFNISFNKNTIIAMLKINTTDKFHESAVRHLEILTINEKLVCKFNKNLVAAYIKPIIEELKTALDDNSYEKVVFNLEDSNSIDSIGITFLIGVYKTLIEKDKKLIVTGLSDSLVSLFKIMKLDETFIITESIDAS